MFPSLCSSGHTKLKAPGVTVLFLIRKGINSFSFPKQIGQNGPSSRVPSALFFRRTDSRKGYIVSALISSWSRSLSPFLQFLVFVQQLGKFLLYFRHALLKLIGL